VWVEQREAAATFQVLGAIALDKCRLARSGLANDVDVGEASFTLDAEDAVGVAKVSLAKVGSHSISHSVRPAGACVEKQTCPVADCAPYAPRCCARPLVWIGSYQSHVHCSAVIILRFIDPKRLTTGCQELVRARSSRSVVDTTDKSISTSYVLQ